MEERLVEIELKLISVEDTVQQLNGLVYAQQQQIDDLRALCRLLIRQQEDGTGAPPRLPADERPPHY